MLLTTALYQVYNRLAKVALRSPHYFTTKVHVYNTVVLSEATCVIDTCKF